MPPPLTQSPGQTRMVPIREPSLLGDPGRQLRLPLLESGLKPRRLQPPLLLPPGQGLPQKPRQLPQEMGETLLLRPVGQRPMVLSPETVRYPHAREPRPQDPHHLMGPAPIDGVDGPRRAGKNPQPGPLPPDPPPRLIGVHRHRVPEGLHQLLIDRLRLLRQSLIGLAQARGRHLQTPGHPEQLRHLPRDAQPMLQVRRQRPRPRPEADPRRPRRRRHLPGMARPHPLPASMTVATLRPKPRDDRLMGGPVLQGSPTLRTGLQRDFHRLLDGLLGRPTPAPDDGPVSAHPGKRAPPNAVPAAPRLPGRRSASAPPLTAPGAIPLGPGAVPIQPRAADHSDKWTSQSSSSI
jgi:hypothetical protein